MNAHRLYSLLRSTAGAACSVPWLGKRLNPFVLRLRLTNRCNLACSYCYAKARRDPGDLLDDSEWREIMRKLPLWTALDITGGEPLAHPAIGKILPVLLKDRGRRTSLITNATLLDDSLAEVLVENGLLYLMFSFDGLEVVHDSLRGAGNFARSWKNLRRLRERMLARGKSFPIFNAKLNLNADMHADLPVLARRLHDELGVRRFTINLFYQNRARGGNPLLDSLSDPAFSAGNEIVFSAAEQRSMTLALEFVSGLKRELPGIQVELRPEIQGDSAEAYLAKPASFFPEPCRHPLFATTLHADGTVSPCDLSLRAGNVRDYDLNLGRLLRDEAYQSLIRNFLPAAGISRACQGCCFVPHFSGGNPEQHL